MGKKAQDIHHKAPELSTDRVGNRKKPSKNNKKRDDSDDSVSLSPLSVEEALKGLLNTPPV